MIYVQNAIGVLIGEKRDFNAAWILKKKKNKH